MADGPSNQAGGDEPKMSERKTCGDCRHFTADRGGLTGDCNVLIALQQDHAAPWFAGVASNATACKKFEAKP